MMTTWLILARAIHIGACLLYFGVFAFDRFVATTISANAKSMIGDYWQKRIRIFSLVSLPAILLSGIMWFILATVIMSGQPLQAEILKTVWTRTQFGSVWTIRLVFWFAAAVITILFHFLKSNPSFQKKLFWLQLCLSGALLGSLAWAGHGQETSTWHLFADVLHLVVAGFWPAGLLPLTLLLNKLRQMNIPLRWKVVATLVHRFSTLSLVSVALLVATGFINSWFFGGFLFQFAGTNLRTLAARQNHSVWSRLVHRCGKSIATETTPRTGKCRNDRRSTAIQYPGGIISRSCDCHHRGGSRNFTTSQSLMACHKRVKPPRSNMKKLKAVA